MHAKSDHILDAALPVFVRHGFRKTSMADIARAANISRASLYLSFSGKEELFRAGRRAPMPERCARSRRCWPAAATFSAGSKAPSRPFIATLIAPFAGSPDAIELFDVNMALAKDITLAARARLVALLAQALADAQAAGAVALDPLNSKPDDVANVIVAAMDGIKHAPGDGAKLEEAHAALHAPAARRYFLRNLSAGMVTLISRGFGLTKFASAKTTP